MKYLTLETEIILFWTIFRNILFQLFKKTKKYGRIFEVFFKKTWLWWRHLRWLWRHRLFTYMHIKARMVVWVSHVSVVEKPYIFNIENFVIWPRKEWFEVFSWFNQISKPTTNKSSTRWNSQASCNGWISSNSSQSGMVNWMNSTT